MGISANIGNNIVYCKGKIVMGKKYYHMIFSYFLLTIPIIALTYMIVNNLDKRIFSLPILILYYFYVASTYNLIMAGTSDPGIFERKYMYYDGKSTSYYRINGFIHKLNVCYTCNIIRPPRTSHCAECDDCIERFDHHCVWIGNCVGKRNYKYFFLFLLHLNIFGVYGIIISSYVVSLKYSRISLNLEDLDRVYIHIGLSIAVVIYIFGFIFLFLGKLFLLHFWLCIQNLTFYEHIKEKWINYPYKNPFDKKSCCRNFISLICRKVPKGSLETDFDKKVKYEELIQY